MSRRVIHLVMNFTKMVKGLYSENCNTLMKKIEEVLNKLKAIPSSCTDRKYDTNLYNTQINLQLQCSPCKNLNGILLIFQLLQYHFLCDDRRKTHTLENTQKLAISFLGGIVFVMRYIFHVICVIKY